MATAAAGIAALTLALASAGVLVPHLELGVPLLAQGALIVAIGGTILGVTSSAVGLLVTRHASDPTGRRRAWLGAALSVVLLVALVMGFQRDLLGGPMVSEAGETGGPVPQD